jgi:hypothetical protein
VKTKPATRTSRPTRAASGAKRTAAKRAAAKRAVPTRAVPKRAAATRAVPKRAAAKRAAPKRVAAKRAAPKRAAPKPATARGRTDRWLRFVEQHGVVLASAHGPVPCIADAVAGQPIVGSWWAHPQGKAIFAALSALDDAEDVRCFKLVDGKVTFVHRRVWPALARLASGGVLAAARVAAIQQEHMPTGEHRNVVMPYPDWVPDDVARAAAALTIDAARAQLGAWV